MNYAWDITVPANTLEKSPKEQTLKLTKGVITKIELKYPAGCHGMVKVKLLRYEHQLVPVNPVDWVTGDDEPVTFPEYYELKATPYQLKFQACSPGTDYPHTISVRISVLEKEIASIMPLVELLTKLLKRLGVIR